MAARNQPKINVEITINIADHTNTKYALTHLGKKFVNPSVRSLYLIFISGVTPKTIGDNSKDGCYANEPRRNITHLKLVNVLYTITSAVINKLTFMLISLV